MHKYYLHVGARKSFTDVDSASGILQKCASAINVS